MLCEGGQIPGVRNIRRFGTCAARAAVPTVASSGQLVGRKLSIAGAPRATILHCRVLRRSRGDGLKSAKIIGVSAARCALKHAICRRSGSCYSALSGARRR